VARHRFGPEPPRDTEIAANVVNSTEFCAPIGNPSRNVRSSGRSASASLRHGSSIGSSSRRAITSSAASPRKRVIVVASADPGAPIAGNPQ